MSALLIWKEYCLKSSIHGLRYIVEPKRPFYERLLWMVLVGLAASFVLYQHWESWKSFSNSPTQIVVDNPRYPIEKIDFPAVTVCSINKSMFSKVLTVMSELYGNITEPEQEAFLNTMLTLSLTGYPFYNYPVEFAKTVNYSIIYLNPDEIEPIMKRVGPTIDEMLSHCYWRGTPFECTSLWRLQRTEEGFCYSFNSKTAERNSQSPMNPPFEISNGTFEAIRNNAAGKITGLEFFLKDLEHEYLPNDNRVRGYSVTVHSPQDFPDVSSSYLVFKDEGKVYRISVTVSTTIGHESLNRISESKRKCYIDDDYLEVTPNSEVPTIVGNGEINCYQRCRLRAIARHCNCTPYYFKPIKQNLKPCGIRHIECLGKVNVLQRNTQAPKGEPGFPTWSIPEYMNCRCPQPCSFVTYSTEVRNTFADFLNEKSYYVYVDVMYKELFAISYTRFLKYTLQDLLVSFGGVASLFLGFSLIGVAELLYYTIYSIHVYIKPPSAKQYSSGLNKNTDKKKYSHRSGGKKNSVDSELSFSDKTTSVCLRHMDDYVFSAIGSERVKDKIPHHIQPFLF